MSAPSIGRIVHFTDTERGTLAAIVTKVADEGHVWLTAFQPDALPGWLSLPVPFADEPRPGHWSWPPRT